MKIIIIKKSFLYSLSCIFLLIIIVLSHYKTSQPVYKDRFFWEKTGEIVWEVQTEEKIVALTFDDGPSPTFTEKLLDLFIEYDAKATFFVMGKQVEKYPEIVLRQHMEGHEIGNHTYNHPQIANMSEESLFKELKKAHDLIYNIIKEDIKIFRPTSGYYDRVIVNAAQKLAYTVIIWTWGLDSQDWTNKDGKNIAKNIINSVKPGTIILFHDMGGDRSNTIEAVEILLQELPKKGYSFVTVSELLEYNEGKKHNVIKTID